MSPPNYRVVPDALWERDPIQKGRKLGQFSQQLIDGRTLFVEGERKTWGHLYKLAKKYNKKARTKVTEVNGVVGTLIKFED